MKYLIFILSIFIFGCSHLCGQEPKNTVDTTITEVISPQGKKAYVVKCETPADCYAISGRMCPGGYARIDGWFANRNVVHFGGNTTALIQCSQPQALQLLDLDAIQSPYVVAEEPANEEVNSLFVQPEQKNPNCNRTFWTGQYLIKSELKRGICVSEIPDTIIELSAGETLNKSVSDGCVSQENWSESECKLVRTTYCNRDTGYEIHKAMFIQDSPDGSLLSGGKIVRRVSSDTHCSGHFKLTAIRQ